MVKNKNINEIKTPIVRWVHLGKNSDKEISYLRNNFKFHPLDLADCLSPIQRPKLDEYENYLFLTLTFPYWDRVSREIMSSEIDFFIGADYLVTVTDGKLPPINKFFEQCRVNDVFRVKFLNHNPVQLLAEAINRLQIYIYPMLDHISQDITNVEKVIFEGYEKKMVKEILLIRRNIINFRKSMQAHKNVIKKLINAKEKFFITNNTHLYLNNILEQTKDIWDILDGLKEYIDALHNTNESLISFRLNDIMRILTIISVTLLPASLIINIFGMNASNMPLVDRADSFWIILAMMVGMIIILLGYFKKKNWL